MKFTTEFSILLWDRVALLKKNMDLSLKDLFKIEATALAGLFAGNAMYVNAADHPARMTLDTVNCRKTWKEAFRRAKKFQVSLIK